MLIAQITDIHLGFQPDDPAELNRRRFDEVIASLRALNPPPAALLVTGDMSESGSVASYETLKSVLDTLPFPALPAIGNHDDRGNFCHVFPDAPLVGGFLQYALDLGPLRIVVLDSAQDGRHGGQLDARRLDWLAGTLAQSAKPTILVLHHPPIETGNGWMTEDISAPWVQALRLIVTANPHVIRLVCGHLHRAMVMAWAGSTLAVCPSTAPQVAIDFRALDPEHPDGRDMIVAEVPGFALHYWTGSDLITQFGSGGDHPVLARFNARMQPSVRHIVGERRR
ncbi:MAG: hypothetical protein RL490_2701 [Pseudomonadota bacterium]